MIHVTNDDPNIDLVPADATDAAEGAALMSESLHESSSKPNNATLGSLDLNASLAVAGGGPILGDLVTAQALIMVVDDEPTILEVVRIYLEDAGYKGIITTTDSANAVNMAKTLRPDLMLLDLMMPRTTGFDILRVLRELPDMRFLPVVVLTSSTDPNAKLQALELGANDLLAKPVDPSELLLRLRNTLTAKAYQDRLAYLDHVTGIANRRLFLERLNTALHHARVTGEPMAVIQVGLDRFSHVNDAYGYGSGDEVLRLTAARLQGALRCSSLPVMRASGTGDLLARTGGDEFIVLLPNICSVAEVQSIAERLKASVSAPLPQVGAELVMTATVGVARVPEDGTEPDGLLARAGQAVSFGKKRGGDSVVFYADEIESWARERLELERDLRIALERGEVQLALSAQDLHEVQARLRR